SELSQLGEGIHRGAVRTSGPPILHPELHCGEDRFEARAPLAHFAEIPGAHARLIAACRPALFPLPVRPFVVEIVKPPRVLTDAPAVVCSGGRPLPRRSRPYPLLLEGVDLNYHASSDALALSAAEPEIADVDGRRSGAHLA